MSELIPRGSSKSRGLQRFVERVRSVIGFKELDLPEAREILQLVVNTHESTLSETSDLSRLGSYSLKDVRQAFKIVAFEIFRRNGLLPPNDHYVIKETPSGDKLLLAIFSNNKKPNDLTMQLGRGLTLEYLITANVPLAEPENQLEKFYAGVFIDRRAGHDIYAQPYGEFNLSEHQKSWLGFRWIAENLLRWDNGFRLPEELEPKLHQISPPAR